LIDLVLLHIQPGCRGFRVVQLALLVLEVVFHFVNFLATGQIVLPGQVTMHFFKQLGNVGLVVLDLSFVLHLLLLVLDRELVNLLFLLVQDLVLLFIATRLVLFQVVFNFLYVSFVLLHHFSAFKFFFFKLLQFNVVLFDPILEALSRFGQGQFHFVGLEFQVILFLKQGHSLFFQVLGALLEGIGPKAGFCVCKAGVSLFQLVPRCCDFLVELVVLFFKFFVVVSLLRVKVIKFGFVLKIDLLNLLFEIVDFSFHIPLLREQVVEMTPLLVILVFDMHE